MGTKSDKYLFEYKITNNNTGETFQARGWKKVAQLAGVPSYNRTTLQKTKKWTVEVVSEPEEWDEATYRQHLYEKNKHKYVGYEKKKKERDLLFETRKRLRFRYKNWINKDGSEFTAEQHDAMLQTNCEVCNSTEQLCVDHDHSSGIVRGTLCNRCNLALGCAQDNVQILVNLQHYLEKNI